MTMWTDKQLNVINTRDRSILVSAAAGSGKTAVLVQRIINMITDENAPVDIDQLLVVTFTRAAASEMKERIRETLENLITKNPNNINLRRQLSLIHNAHISTIDSFCGRVVRENFHKLDIDPNYRIADASEIKMLEADILEELLEEKYAQGDEEFENLAVQYSKGKLSDNIGGLILKLYKNAMAQEEPEQWLNNCILPYEITTVDEMDNTVWMQEYLQDIRKETKVLIEKLDKIAPVSESEDGPKLARHIDNFTNSFNGIILAGTYDAMRNQTFEFSMAGSVTVKKGCNPEKADLCKNVIDEAKKHIQELQRNTLKRTSEEIIDEIVLSRQTVTTVVELTQEFKRRFDEALNEKGIMDFTNQNHAALRVLKNTDIAEQMAKQFKEVMIDEYQDSNYIQEAILSRLTNGFGINNMFMVGDVKQSIYRFRKAEPKLFINKYDSFSSDLDSDNCKIVLDKNFRSRKEVVNSVNYIFNHIMHKEVGGIDYQDNNQLVFGARYYAELPDNQDNSTEIVAIEGNGKYIEAEYVAQRIKDLTDPEIGMKVMDKNGNMRPLRFSDIAIVLRKVKGDGQIILDALENYGIPAYTETSGGYFDAMEIRTIIDLLQIIDNPRQDIPLAAVLVSPMFEFTENELAIIKGANYGDCLYDRLNLYDINGNDESIVQKTRGFINTLNKFRKIAEYSTVYELINLILKDTAFDFYIAAMPNGQRRSLNVEILKEKAVAYDNISYKGLFNFLRYIEKVRFLSADEGEACTVSENDNVVRIMTIHKSKGLQFPVVFMSFTNPVKNAHDENSEIVISDNGMIAVDAIDTKTRIKYKTLLRDIVNRDNLKEEKAEDLRLIYVALTRAQEKLIITGSVKSIEKEIPELKAYQKTSGSLMSSKDLVARNTYWYWISRAVAKNKAFDCGIGKGLDFSITDNTYKNDVDIVFKMAYEEDILENALIESVDARSKEQVIDLYRNYKISDEDRAVLNSNLNFIYPYESEIYMQSKASVTEIKKQSMTYVEEIDGHKGIGGIDFNQSKEIVTIIPNFAKENDDERLYGAKRGTAYHRVFELLDLTRDLYSIEDISEMLEGFVSTGAMNKQEADCIDVEDILKFSETKLFSRMKQANDRGQLFREQKFLLTRAVKDIKEDSNSDEPMIMQGIIDVCFIEDGKFIIADYKTDRVDTLQQLVDLYKVQLECYQLAIDQISDVKVSEKIIYSVTLGDEVSL